MTRRQGFPLSLQWGKGLWKAWDKMTKEEREDYEKYYEDRDNKCSTLTNR